MVYIVHSLNYCCVEYYYARAMHALRIPSYEVVTIVRSTQKLHYTTVTLRYNT